MSGPHDLLFRETFSEPEAAAWLLRIALPALATSAQLKRVDMSGIDGGDLRQPDLIWELSPSLRLRIAWQHQSAIDPRMDLRVLRDTAVLLNAWSEQEPTPLPALITLVVTHAPARWSAPTDVRERMRPLPADVEPQVVRCPYTLLDLRDISRRAIERAPAAAAVTLALLRGWQRPAQRDHLWSIFLGMAPHLHALIHAGGLSAIRRFTSYLIRTQPPQPREHLMAQLAQLDPNLPEQFTTWADVLVEEGREEGRQEGREEGRQEGHLIAARRILIRLGTKRFGQPTEAQTRHLQDLSADAVEQLTQDVLEAHSWNELLR